jgi:flagellar FliL protein
MSEEASAVEAPKKKKGKLPIIIVLALLLAAGGFFGMKARGKHPKPELKLGKAEKLDEFLTNLVGSNAYIRTTIALQFVSDFDAKKLEESIPSIKDAVIMRLSTKAVADVDTVEGKIRLKKEIAEDVNKVLAREAGVKPPNTVGMAVHEDWDSQAGPVLRVLFTSFATQ